MNGSLDLSDSEILNLPQGLKIEGDLIIGNANITSLPEDIIIAGDLILNDNDIYIPNTVLIGGVVKTPVEQFKFASEANYNCIIIDETQERFFYKKKIHLYTYVNDTQTGYFFPTVVIYQNFNKNDSRAAVSYKDQNNKQYVMYCPQNFKQAVYQVSLHMAKIRGCDKYQNYDIYQKRSVDELIEIYNKETK